VSAALLSKFRTELKPAQAEIVGAFGAVEATVTEPWSNGLYYNSDSVLKSIIACEYLAASSKRFRASQPSRFKYEEPLYEFVTNHAS